MSALRQFRIFSDRNLRDNAIEKIYRYMELREYKHGHKVYQQGVSETDGVYFIKKGDFEITQSAKVGDPKLKVAKRALSRNRPASHS